MNRTRPNILLLMADQMQHNRMGFVDGMTPTPHLDALAAEGVHFPNAFVVHAQCTPSRSAMQTGKYAHECDVMIINGFHGHHNRLMPSYRTMGHELRDAGYETAFFGKLHVGTPAEDLGYDIANVTDGIRMSDEEAKQKGIEHVPEVLRCNYTSIDDTVSFLQGYQPGEKPLFMTFSTNLPHPPFFFEHNHAEHVPDAETLPIPHSFHAETFENKPAFQAEHASTSHGMHTEEHLRRELREYMTMTTATDAHFGRVIAEFKRLGLWDNTVVIVTADHGDMQGAHRLRYKGTLPYDELYRVPLIVKPTKGQPIARKVVDDMVSTVDLPGTIARAAGLEDSPVFRDADWQALARSDTPTVPDDQQRVYFEHYGAYWGVHPYYGIRTRSIKLVRYYGEDAQLEMYDVENDPHELTNVADDPKYAQVRDQLLAELDQWWQNTGGHDAAYYESDEFKGPDRWV